MPEQITVNYKADKRTRYESLLPQIKSLIEGETDPVANMANISAALKETFDFLWVGFYRANGDNLILGPFQGPVACTRISFGRGVCGTAWKEKISVIVPDVDKFPEHIACNSRSRSEIVVPLMRENHVWAILDIDSEYLNSFDNDDVFYLEQICALF